MKRNTGFEKRDALLSHRDKRSEKVDLKRRGSFAVS